MSVTKSNQPTGAPFHGVKPRIWSLENLSIWIIRMVLNILFFFTFLYIAETQWNVRDDIMYRFLAVFIIYIISGLFSYFLSYLIIKYIFGKFLHRRVKDLKYMIKGKRRMKKLWIYVFTIVFQTIFFILSVNFILAEEIPLSDGLAFVLAWMILWVGSRILGRGLYFIFYTW